MGDRPTRFRIAWLAAIALVVAGCGSDAGSSDGAPVGSSVVAATDDARDTDGGGAAAGPPVPAATVPTFDGGVESLADHGGTPMVVNFWASWCGPCIAEMPDLEAVSQRAGDQVRFVGVNTQDTPDDAAEQVAATGVTYDLLRDPDGELFEAFGVRGMPSTFYVDDDGTIVGRHTGLLTVDALVDDLDEHLGVDVADGGGDDGDGGDSASGSG